MTVLVLGGRGKTASPLANLLDAAKIPFIAASRSSSKDNPSIQAKFNWLMEETWSKPFLKASSENMEPISAVYLVPPPVFEMSPPVIKFIDFARVRGVNRFVLLSATTIESGGEAMGGAHRYLETLASEGLEWAVLRPTWFMDNFSAPDLLHLKNIKNEGRIYSCAGDGKVAFVSAKDIAKVAFHALTDGKPHNTDHIIVGPAPITYYQIAEVLTKVIGREITYVLITQSEVEERYKAIGMPQNDAQQYATFESDSGTGIENIRNSVFKEVTGGQPESFQEFAEREKHSWI